MKENDKCPCGRENPYADCCGRVHQNRINAVSAEDLMRSRYSAFAMAKADFLVESLHSMDKLNANREELEKYARSIKWKGLEIISTKLGGVEDNVGYVEFKAHFKQKGKKHVQHEYSKFVREFGQWVYWGIAEEK